jgi:hypothetical protein
MQRGVTIWLAAGYLGMLAEVLERTYGHHHPDYMRAAAQATAIPWLRGRPGGMIMAHNLTIPRHCCRPAARRGFARHHVRAVATACWRSWPTAPTPAQSAALGSAGTPLAAGAARDQTIYQ